jgi:chemotaxis protein methyltransferase CheR
MSTHATDGSQTLGEAPAITPAEFGQIQRFIQQRAGIHLAATKQSLVCGRLRKRLSACGVASYGDYLALLAGPGGGAEAQTAVDLLTTNETYFFREPKHFDFLHEVARQPGSATFRFWSAASSSGEEAYSAAMVLDQARQGRPFEILGTDISARMLARACRAHYPMQRLEHFPDGYLKRYCLRGQGEHAGSLLIDPGLRGKVRFAQANLTSVLPRLGQFDMVFLRNVMIYFNHATKAQVVARVVACLKPGGYLCIGHSENLGDLQTGLNQLAPSIYQKPHR